jgi:hypothetical protein
MNFSNIIWAVEPKYTTLSKKNFFAKKFRFSGFPGTNPFRIFSKPALLDPA